MRSSKITLSLCSIRWGKFCHLADWVVFGESVPVIDLHNNRSMGDILQLQLEKVFGWVQLEYGRILYKPQTGSSRWRPDLRTLSQFLFSAPEHDWYCSKIILKLKSFLEQTLWFPGRRKMLTTASAPFPSKSPFFKSCVGKRLGIWLTHFLEVEPSFFKITLNGKHITRVLTHRRQILRGNGRKGINMQLWLFTFSDFWDRVYEERH